MAYVGSVADELKVMLKQAMDELQWASSCVTGFDGFDDRDSHLTDSRKNRHSWTHKLDALLFVDGMKSAHQVNEVRVAYDLSVFTISKHKCVNSFGGTHPNTQ